MRWLLCACLLAIGCGAPDDEEAQASSSEGLSVPTFFGGRIALARFYQSAEGKTVGPPRACVANIGDAKAIDNIMSTHPTYVSGAMRIDDGDALFLDAASTQPNPDWDAAAAVYAEPRHRKSDLKYDIVLNATHYTSCSQVEARLDSVQKWFHAKSLHEPDAILFDFYSQGDEQVMRCAGKAIHASGKKVGGVFWKKSDVHDTADFLVLDDHQGLDEMTRQGEALRKITNIPLLAHIENNPTSGGQTGGDRNMGLAFFDGKINRTGYITKMFDAQHTGGYRLMYPVAFPLNEQYQAWNPSSEKGYLKLVESMMGKSR